MGAMGCGGAADEPAQEVEVKTVEEKPVETEDRSKGKTRISLFVGKHIKINMLADGRNSLKQIRSAGNEVLADFEAWNEKYMIEEIASTWSEHLNYCVEDHLDEIDEWEERKASKELHFLATVEQHLTAQSYDDMEPGYFDADESVYWKKDGESNHVIDVREPLSLG